MVSSIANALCALINHAFPHLVGFVSTASGDVVIAAALGIVLALVLGYRGLQYALSGEHTPHKRARRVRCERPPRKVRHSVFSDDDSFNAEWMDYAAWEESR